MESINQTELNAQITLAYHKKEYNECLDLLKISLGRNPSFVLHKILQAECWTALKINHRKVIETFSQVIAEDPKCANAYFAVGQAYYYQGDLDEAVEKLDQAILLNVSNEMLKAVELKQKARNLMEAICDANVKFEMNHIERALKILSMASSIDPTNDSIQKKITEIRDFFIKELVTRLDNEVDRELKESCGKLELKALLEKAEKLIKCQKFAESDELMEQIEKFKSAADELTFLKGYALYMSGSLLEAVGKFQETLKMNPDHKRALKLFDKATTLNTLFDSANQSLVKMEHEAAIENFTEILTVDEDNTKVIQAALFQRSLAHFNMGSSSKALKDFKLFEASANSFDPSGYIRN